MKAILFYTFSALAVASMICFLLGDHAGTLFVSLISGIMALIIACIAKEDAEREEITYKNYNKKIINDNDKIKLNFFKDDQV